MKRHRWVIIEIWLLTAHLCPPRTRVLDTCSETESANHIGVYKHPIILVPNFNVLFQGAHHQFGLYVLQLYLCHVCHVWDVYYLLLDERLLLLCRCGTLSREYFVYDLYSRASVRNPRVRMRRISYTSYGQLFRVAPMYLLWVLGKRRVLGPADIPMEVS